MNPTISPVTGDPTIDGILGWVTNGGSLDSPGAVIGLATVVKIVLIPLLARMCARFHVNFNGPTKLQSVVGVSVIVAFIINVVTHAHLHFGDVSVLGIHIALTAVGIHEGASTLSSASKAQQDIDQVRNALAAAPLMEDPQAATYVPPASVTVNVQ